MNPRVLKLPVLVNDLTLTNDRVRRWKLFAAFVHDHNSELSELDMRDVRPGMLAATYSQWQRAWLLFLWSKAQLLVRLDKLMELVEWAQELAGLLFRSVHQPRWGPIDKRVSLGSQPEA